MEVHILCIPFFQGKVSSFGDIWLQFMSSSTGLYLRYGEYPPLSEEGFSVDLGTGTHWRVLSIWTSFCTAFWYAWEQMKLPRPSWCPDLLRIIWVQRWKNKGGTKFLMESSCTFGHHLLRWNKFHASFILTKRGSSCKISYIDLWHTEKGKYVWLIFIPESATVVDWQGSSWFLFALS